MKNTVRGVLSSIAVMLLVTLGARPAPAETVLKLASESATGAIQFRALEKLAEYVKQKTKGEYSIRIFPAGQLGPVREAMQQLKMGTLDLTGATNKLNIVSGMAEAPLLKVIRELVPFLIIEIAVLILVTYVPVLSTWLPSIL